MNNNQTLKPGTLLRGNGYRIERVLGSGGFGITYLAYDCGLDEYVAIKEFFPTMLCSRQSDSISVSSNATDMVESLKAKFIKEARRLSKLRVPGVVMVRSAFEENGTAYYVMDYIEGGNLNDIVKQRGPLSTAEALGYIGQIAEALGAVHARNINHLDIKPANIMLDSESSRAILIDFGLAKQYDEQGHQTSSTPTGLSHGYAPLEQYHQSGVRNFSPQADIYSLGATLYYLLSGEVPPHATDLTFGSLTFPDRIPLRLRRVISHAMAANPKERYATVAGFMADLQQAATNTIDFEPQPELSTEKAVQVQDTDNTTVVATTSKPMPLRYIALIIAGILAIAFTIFVLIRIKLKASKAESPVQDNIEEITKESDPGYQFLSHDELPNLSMALKYNDEVYYVTDSEWIDVPDSIKQNVEKLGLVVKGDSLEFILAPEDLASESITLNDALTRYENLLPTKSQAELIGNNYKEVNEALANFGFSQMSENYYWTSTIDKFAPAYYITVNMKNGNIYGYLPDLKNRVRAVYPIPSISEDSNQPISSFTSQDENPEYKLISQTTAPNLSLALKYNDTIYYVTETEWSKIPQSIKENVTKLGLIVRGDGLEFMIESKNLISGNIYWEDAMNRFGKRLPSLSEAEIMLSQNKAINKARQTFELDPINNDVYWTSEESDSSSAWAYSMYDGRLTKYAKHNPRRVQGIAKVPKNSDQNNPRRVQGIAKAPKISDQR